MLQCSGLSTGILVLGMKDRGPKAPDLGGVYTTRGDRLNVKRALLLEVSGNSIC